MLYLENILKLQFKSDEKLHCQIKIEILLIKAK